MAVPAEAAGVREVGVRRPGAETAEPLVVPSLGKKVAEL